MSSFGESTAMKLSSTQASKYVQYNRRQISRTYPAGSRVTSTNYDPVAMWNAGCQIGECEKGGVEEENGGKKVKRVEGDGQEKTKMGIVREEG